MWRDLLNLALLFLRLGTTAFGGPAAHVGMMEDEVVRRRGWLTHDEFLDLFGASNLIPGPSSTELAIFIGQRRAGLKGLVLAGLCFILPAFLMVSLLAWVYVRFGRLPQVAGLLYGVKPVVIAVIGQALWNLGRRACKTRLLAALAALATAASFLGVSPLAVLFGTGLVSVATGAAETKRRPDLRPLAVLLGVVAVLIAVPILLGRYAGPRHLGLPSLFLAFLKLGSVVYGSGYVLLAFLRADLVTQRGWLTSGQLLDAVAVGQVTPGPVFTTATFIGFLLGGWRGALAATIGIFVPAFLMVAIGGRFLPRLRRSPVAASFLDGVNVAALALMAAVAWELGRAALVDAVTLLLALASAVLLIRFRVNSAWLVLGGALVGLAAVAFGWR